MHAIHRDELLSQRVRRAVGRGATAGDSTDDFAGLGEPAEVLRESLAGDAPPVGGHAGLEGGVGEDRGGPFDGVDFGHEGAVDEARLVEDLIAGEGA